MLFIVDGTGESDDKIYARSNSASFCSQMRSEFGGYYHRGPTIFDRSVSTSSIADEIYDAITNSHRLGREPLYLAGHSRGGAAVIYAAKTLLKKKSVNFD